MKDKTNSSDNYLFRKRLLGLALGLVLAIIVLNVDKKLWWPLELETINARNTSSLFTHNDLLTDDIAVILFDDKTQFLLREDGLPIKDFEKKGRELLSHAIEKLEASRVRAIGINLNLTAPSDLQKDENLAKTISKFKNIVIAKSVDSVSTYPLNKILKSASNLGYGELYADYDKIVHRIKLFERESDSTPSFSYAIYKTISNEKSNINLMSRSEFYLRYPHKSITKYSFIDLIQGKVNPSLLENKIVIVGIGLRSKLMRDELTSPFNRAQFISDSEVQAISLANLLTKSYLTNLGLKDFSFHFIVLSIIFGILFNSIPVVRGITIGAVLFVTLILLAGVIYSHNCILLEMVPLAFMLLCNFLIGSLIYLQLNLQEHNLELGEALNMLGARSHELENSRKQLEQKNTQLSNAFNELHQRVSELKEVRKQLSERGEQERKRIARELHDDTLARITDLRIYIESIINSGNVSITEKKNLGAAIQTLDNVTSEVRRIINALRPSMLDNALGLLPAIENLLDDLSRRSGHKIQTKLNTSLARLKLSETSEINLYRIVQEALNNVFKHSNATKAEILIEEQHGQILVLVSDNGNGLINNRNKKGFGLIDMKERAELIGASVQYLNKPKDTGSTIEITMPVDEITRVEKTKPLSNMVS